MAGDDEVDRNQVYSSALDADHGHPLRKKPPDLLDNAEEIIGTVDLIHFAGLGVADDEARPVDAPGHGTLAPDDLLRLVLAFEVGMIEPARLVEHVLPKRALIEPGSSNRTHMMKAPRPDLLGERDGVSRARDIGFHLDQRVCGQIVDRGEMKDVINLAPQRLFVFIGDPKARLQDIPFDRDRALGARLPECTQPLQPLRRWIAHEEIHGCPIAGQKLPNQPPADKAAGARDEVNHAEPPCAASPLSFAQRG